MSNTYDVGDLVRCVGVFADSEAAAIDPTTVTFKVREPSGDVVAYVYSTDAEVVRDGEGNYHVDVSATEAGTWHYRYESTGTGQAAGENEFEVRVSAF